MSDGLLSMLALVVAVAGMGAFALANATHWRQLLGTRQQTAAMRVGCKLLGTVLLGGSFVLCVLADPITMALLVWPMLLGVSAAIIAVFLTTRSRRQRPE